MVHQKERPPSDYSAGRDKVWDKERIRDRGRKWDVGRAKERSTDRNQTRSQDRSFSSVDRGRNVDRDTERNGHGHGSRDRQRERGRDGNRARHRSRERELDDNGFTPTRGCSKESLEWEDHKNRPRLPSGPNEVFVEPVLIGPSNEGRPPGHSPRERGMDRGPCV